MSRIPLLKIALLVSIICVVATAAFAQWATPTVDGFIANGEYGTNNQLNNAGNTGQTWYMTWDANNLYVGIVNANLSEGAVIYIKGQSAESADLLLRMPTVTSPASTTTAQISRRYHFARRS